MTLVEPFHSMFRSQSGVRVVMLAGLLVPSLAGAEIDIALGDISGITEVAHEGVFPSGAAAFSMSSTACNVGIEPIPYLAPMAEEHPVVVMQLYRESNGRFEQIGMSDARHEYFALSNSECSPCQQPSGGLSLGAGCSTTSGVGINADRLLLGPREEVDPWLGRWKCTGSHFSGGIEDCERRHGDSGHGPLDHRLTARDQDLGLAGASYFYEAYFIAEEDQDHADNLGSRTCTMIWTGSHWAMATPPQGIVPGPALLRWGGLQSWAAIPDDGMVLLASKALDLGGDRYRYEYALFNLDSARRARRLSIPVGTAEVTAIGFHDSDGDPSNDWPAAVVGGVLTWETDPADVDPNGHGLIYGALYNFWFESDVPPSSGEATLEAWEPTGDDVVVAAAQVPSSASNVPDAVASSSLRLSVSPNPTRGSAELGFVLAEECEVSLEIFDARGSSVRSLVNGRETAGERHVLWDGRDERGRDVGAGVYFATVRAGGHSSTRAITILR